MLDLASVDAPEAPAFLAWSPKSEDDAYLLVGQMETLVVYKYKTEQTTLQNSLERIKHLKVIGEIHDVTWEQCISSEIRRPIALLEDRTVCFSDVRL